MIQACQQFENVEIALPGDVPRRHLDAKAGNPPESKYIVLRRPHTLLLLSSVSGGMAVRGAYTEAFTHQMSKSDGQLEIEQMQSRARIYMQKHHPGCSSQIPEMRSTLMKMLKLPPARPTPESEGTSLQTDSVTAQIQPSNSTTEVSPPQQPVASTSNISEELQSVVIDVPENTEDTYL